MVFLHNPALSGSFRLARCPYGSYNTIRKEQRIIRVQTRVMRQNERIEEAAKLIQQGLELQGQGQLDEAIRLYERSARLHPTAEAYTYMGWAKSYQGRIEEAIDHCRRAITIDPEFGNPYNDIGSYLIAQGDLWACVRWFRRALLAPRYESYAFPHFNLGRVYEQRHRPLDAARHYGHALEEQPGFAQAAKALRRVQARLN